jgi:hypothetical protein
MDRRKFLIGAGSLAAGSAAAMGTGAFTQAEAARSVEVDVVTDENAYLRLTPTSPYAETRSGKLVIDFSENGMGGQGVNKDSDYLFNDVFGIQNQGTNDNIYIAANVTGQLAGPDNNQILNLFRSSDGAALTYPDPTTKFDNLDNKFAPKQSDPTESLIYPQLDSGEGIHVGIDLTVDDVNTQELTGEINIIGVQEGT